MAASRRWLVPVAFLLASLAGSRAEGQQIITVFDLIGPDASATDLNNAYCAFEDLYDPIGTLCRSIWPFVTPPDADLVLQQFEVVLYATDNAVEPPPWPGTTVWIRVWGDLSEVGPVGTIANHEFEWVDVDITYNFGNYEWFPGFFVATVLLSIDLSDLGISVPAGTTPLIGFNTVDNCCPNLDPWAFAMESDIPYHLPCYTFIDSGGEPPTLIEQPSLGGRLTAILEPICLGNVDGDSEVGVVDLLALLAAWGTAGADLDGDNNTSVTDLLILLGNWGPC